MAATLSLTDLADRFALKIVKWDEDGLGDAQGCLLKLPSGRIVMAWDIDHSERTIVSIDVDAGDAVQMGLPALLEEVSLALHLSADQIEPNNPDAGAFLAEAQILMGLSRITRQKPQI